MITFRFIGLCFLGIFGVSGCESEIRPDESKKVESDFGPNCQSINACIDILSTHLLDDELLLQASCGSGVTLDYVGNALHKLAEFERAAVVELIPLLKHSNCQVRKRIALAINYNGYMLPEDFSELIEAHKNGVPWLEVPIGLTQTGAALDYLWLEFLYDPSEDSNIQSIMGLAKFGDRVHPKIVPVISRCMREIEATVCFGMVDLAEYFENFPPSAKPLFEKLSNEPSLNEFQQQKALWASKRF